MKHNTCFLPAVFVLFLILFSSSLKAVTLYVDEDGSSDFYSIQEALDACSPGDRIVVVPKSDGSAYLNMFVNKNNIEVVSSIETERFKVSGLIAINGSGVKLINCEYTGGSYFSWAEMNIAGNDVDFIYCKFNFCKIKNSSGNTNFHLYKDSLINCSVETFGSAVIAGCYMLLNYPGSNDFIYKFDINYDDLEIIGNTFRLEYVYDFDMMIGHSSGAPYIKIMNNFFDDESSSSINFITYVSSTMFPSTVRPFVIENNSFRSNGLVENIFEFSFFTEQLLVVKNNVFDSNGYCVFSSSIPLTPVLRYNYFSNVYGIFFPVVDGTNVINASNTIDNYGGNSPGSSAINGGDPGPKYLDLDLTRNDAGCFGGSYSMWNFTTAETGTRVLMMRTKRVVYAGQPIDVSAEGVDR
jgi:hypothetical protein